MGSDIGGEAAYDRYGFSVSMSSDGTRVAIGADGANHVCVHRLQEFLSCDASTAPTNGAVGNCTSSLASGSTCQPTCNSGYTVSGTSSCSFGTLTAATCAPPPSSTTPHPPLSYLCQFPQDWLPDHSFEDPDSPGTNYTCTVYANWVTGGSSGGPTDVDASWTCAGTTQVEQYHVGTVATFGCCGPSGRSACCSQIVSWRSGVEDQCSSSPPVPAISTPSPPSPPTNTALPPPQPSHAPRLSGLFVVLVATFFNMMFT